MQISTQKSLFRRDLGRSLNLSQHPFPVEAFFERSLVLTFAVPKEELAKLLPECLTLDVYDEKWAFLAIALVQTKDLRPKGFPKFMGNDFFLIGYRIFVRYKNNAGKNWRGLYILKSETDQKKMEYLGNIFTKYKYTTTDILQEFSEKTLKISSEKSKFDLEISNNNENVALPQQSPFPDWKTARRFAGPLPFTFSYDKKTQNVLIVEGVREFWQPRPVEVLNYNFDFLTSFQFETCHLANAFSIENIPYHWKKGVLEKWKK